MDSERSKTLPSTRSFSSLSETTTATSTSSYLPASTGLMASDQLKFYTRRHQLPTPNYAIIDERREDLHKWYQIRVTVDLSRGGLVIADGKPRISRRLADDSAARAAIERIAEFDASILQPIRVPTRRRPRRGLSMVRSLSMDVLRRSISLSGFSIRSLKGANADGGEDNHKETNAGSSQGASSLEGIDSIVDNSSCYSDNANAKEGEASVATPKLMIEEEEEDGDKSNKQHNTSHNNKEAANIEDDEGVCSGSNLSSPHSTAKSSPSPPQEEKKVTLTTTAKAVEATDSANTSSSSKQSSKSKSSHSGGLSTFILETLRRSFRRSQKSTENAKKVKSYKIKLAPPATVFSSTTSIDSSSSDASSTNNSQSSTSGSYNTMEESNFTNAIASHSCENNVNGRNNSRRMLPSVITEEDENDEGDETIDTLTTLNTSRSLNDVLDNEKDVRPSHVEQNMPVRRSQSSRTLATTEVECSCGQKHFTIYGCLLCSHQRTGLHRVGETEGEAVKASTARLARYCVQMYLPVPFYDLRTDKSSSSEDETSSENGDQFYRFYTTCRVTMTPTRCDRKLLVNIPSNYRNHVFTTKGAGRDYREARLVAAQKLLDKLKQVNLLPAGFDY